MNSNDEHSDISDSPEQDTIEIVKPKKFTEFMKLGYELTEEEYEMARIPYEPSIFNKIMSPKIMIINFSIPSAYQILIYPIYAFLFHKELLNDAFSLSMGYILLFLFFSLFQFFGNFVVKDLDQMMHVDGNKSNFIRMMFVSDSEYVKYTRFFYDTIWNKKQAIIALGFATSILAFFLLTFRGFGIGIRDKIYPWPIWGEINTIMFYYFFFILSSYIALLFSVLNNLLYALSKIGKDHEKLSLNLYINNLSFLLNEGKISSLNENDFAASYYVFQRGNRIIGEFLFRVSGILVLMWTIIALISFLLSLVLKVYADFVVIYIFSALLLDVISIGFFIFPQIEIHLKLKRYKYLIIDIFNKKLEELNDLFVMSFRHEDILAEINSRWKTRQELYEEVYMIESYLKRVDMFGTWSYDFPEVLKIIAVALVALLPIFIKLIFGVNFEL
ncbi:MAG: hypothetical protein ACTSYS_04745 [Promethearchaeota archaeon]